MDLELMKIRSKIKLTDKLWRLDPSKIAPGDVLLERSPTAISAVIRTVTGGAYSHALISIGVSDFLEAVGTGVRVISYARIFTYDPDSWSLLRFTGGAGLAREAATYARKQSFKEYNLKGALTSTLQGYSFPSNAGALFCSELVARAYENAGVQLFPGKLARNITPADLEQSPLLHKADNPFVEITDPSEKTVLADLEDRDEAYKNSCMQLEVIASLEAFKAVRHLVQKIPRPLNSAITFPPASLNELIELLGHEKSLEGSACAEALLTQLESRNYFSLLVPMMAELRGILQSQLVKLQMESPASDVALQMVYQLQQISAPWGETKQRWAMNAQACWNSYQFNQRRLFQRLATMYVVNASAFDDLQEMLDASPAYVSLISVDGALTNDAAKLGRDHK